MKVVNVKKRRKVRYDRIAVLVIGCVLLIGAIFAGVGCMKDDKRTKTSDHPVSSEKDSVKDITQVEGYQVLKAYEVAELVTAFNSMANALSAIETSRRNFVANVSHELKTPMTTIGGFIDGILEDRLHALS